jgi:hypothetical protein
MSLVMQGSALRCTPDPATAKIPFSERAQSGTRSVLLDYGSTANLVMQGSALRRASDPAAAKIPFSESPNRHAKRVVGLRCDGEPPR